MVNSFFLLSLPSSLRNKEQNKTMYLFRRKHGQVVRVLDFESVRPGFQSHSEHFMDLFHGSPEL